MKDKNKSREKISRRTFCTVVPCAAAGLLYGFPDLSPGMCFHEGEGKMAKKITAVEVKVISQKGSCAMGHKVGDVTTFTETGVEGKICIHALYSMMPGVFAMMHEAKFDWLKDPDKKTHACPDAYNPVVFEIKRIREK